MPPDSAYYTANVCRGCCGDMQVYDMSLSGVDFGVEEALSFVDGKNIGHVYVVAASQQGSV